ncbi:MAG: hypothetical protein IIA44_09340, partial [Acidobacteria bacterium]|nr:hypothetical protein [Acidobacteriota bacterium]
MAGRQPKLQASINGVTYNLRDWRTVQQGQVLKQEWDQGFARGMGDYLFMGSVERYQEALNFDTTRTPQVRLPPTRTTVTISGLDSDLPVYNFLARDSGGTEYCYVLNGQFSYKVDVSAMAVDETKDFGANSQCGRPALFEDNWYVPLGNTNNFQRLTTVAVPASSDTWDSPGSVKALAFATGSKDGTAQLARAHTTNNVDLSSNGSDWTGADFEVGDSSIGIVDMHYWQGEYAVVKQDGVWLFDTAGDSFHIEQYVARTDDPDASNDGANSFAHGAYFYWADRTGLWRFFGQRGGPIGFDSDPRWDTPFTDVIGTSSPNPNWYSVTAFGRWLY